jgi:para-nitrobenzyl esterase
MKPSLSLAFASLFLTVSAISLTANVATSGGPIYGNHRDANGILSFKGIPYAQPPVGNLRWKPPTTHASWTTPVDATTFGATC